MWNLLVFKGIGYATPFLKSANDRPNKARRNGAIMQKWRGLSLRRLGRVPAAIEFRLPQNQASGLEGTAREIAPAAPM